MSALFSDVSHGLARTLEIAERCAFSLAELRYRYPAERLPEGESTMDHLRRLTLEGARGRYADAVPADVTRQIEHELAVIEKLDYCGYFLTLFEIVQFCRPKKILCQGR